jgi:hypothetical protein
MVIEGRCRSNALVQLQARYNHCGEAASEKCLSAATFVRPRGRDDLIETLLNDRSKVPIHR